MVWSVQSAMLVCAVGYVVVKTNFSVYSSGPTFELELELELDLT